MDETLKQVQGDEGDWVTRVTKGKEMRYKRKAESSDQWKRKVQRIESDRPIAEKTTDAVGSCPPG